MPNLSAFDTLEVVDTAPVELPGHRRPLRMVGEVILTLAALFGLTVTLITVTAARSGVQPLVVRSGSMEPTIATGSMVLVRRIRASEIRVNDIVTVERPDRTRVTHRVIALERKGDAVAVTLKGDANEEPDPLPVTVTSAQRLVSQVPYLGRAMAWLASAQGGFAMGCVVTLFATRSIRRCRTADA